MEARHEAASPPLAFPEVRNRTSSGEAATPEGPLDPLVLPETSGNSTLEPHWIYLGSLGNSSWQATLACKAQSRGAMCYLPGSPNLRSPARDIACFWEGRWKPPVRA